MRSRSERPRSHHGQPKAQQERSTAAEPSLVVLVDEGTPVGAQVETARFGPPERRNSPRPARAVGAVATAAVIAAGAVLLVRHSDDHSSAPAADNTVERSSSRNVDPGFGGSTQASRPEGTDTAPRARVRFAPEQSVAVSGHVPLPEAQAVGVVVGPLPEKYRHHGTVVVGPAALAKTLVAGHTYSVTFRYYAALDISEASTGHVAAPFAAEMRCPADFRIRPGHSYTVHCRVRPEPGTDSIAFTVTDKARSKWEAGTSVLLVAR